MSVWYVLRSSLKSRVDLRKTLIGGQCFRWHLTSRNSFVGTVHRRVYELRHVVSGVGSWVNSINCDQDFNAFSRGACGVENGGSWIEYRRLYPLPMEPKSDVGKVRKSSLSHKKSEPSGLSNDGKAMFNDEDEEFLSYYLALDVDMRALWRRWTNGNPMKSHPLVSYLVSSSLEALDSSKPPNGIHTVEKRRTKKAALPRNSRQMPLILDFPVRVLRQDLHETLFAFLCSQNNHIKRITAMIDALCANYGDYLCSFNCLTGEVRGALAAPRNGKKRPRGSASRASPKTTTPADANPDDENGGRWLHFYTFPTIEQLLLAREDRLRELGLGYRSRYLAETARQVRSAAPALPTLASSFSTKSREFGAVDSKSRSNAGAALSHSRTTLDEAFYAHLLSLRDSAAERAALMGLSGVGRKIADCTLLFGLGRAALVPVDTHIRQIAAAYLAPAEEIGGAEAPAWMRVLFEWRRQINRAGKEGAEGGKGEGGSEKTIALLPKHHDAIQEGFQAIFGPYSGWAHSALFYARIQ